MPNTRSFELEVTVCYFEKVLSFVGEEKIALKALVLWSIISGWRKTPTIPPAPLPYR